VTGAEAPPILEPYAALKRRSSTVLRAPFFSANSRGRDLRIPFVGGASFAACSEEASSFARADLSTPLRAGSSVAELATLGWGTLGSALRLLARFQTVWNQGQ
jgi:hypothetical protein